MQKLNLSNNNITQRKHKQFYPKTIRNNEILDLNDKTCYK